MDEATQESFNPTATINNEASSDNNDLANDVLPEEITLISTELPLIANGSNASGHIPLIDNIDNDDQNNESDAESTNELADNEASNLKHITLTITDVCKLQRSRRSDNMKDLEKENFGDLNNGNKKQISFYTDNTLLWYDALKEYTVTYNIMNRCELRKNKSELVTICKIHVCFNESKQISISINFVTGILCVKGACHSDWAESDFPKVKEILERIRAEQVATTTGINTCVVNVNENKTEDDVEDEPIQELWKSYDKLATSIKSIEESFSHLEARVTENRNRIEDRCVQLDNKINSMEQNLDAKVTLFQEVMEKSMNEKISAINKSFDNKISSVRTVVGQFKLSTQEQINKISTHGDASNELSEKIEKLQQEMTNSCTGDTEKSIYELKEENDRYVSEIDGKIRDIETQLTSLNRSREGLEKKISMLSINNIGNATHERSFSNGSSSKTSQGNHMDTSTEIIMCIDSNRKHLDFRRLWTLKGTKVMPCGNIQEVKMC